MSAVVTVIVPVHLKDRPFLARSCEIYRDEGLPVILVDDGAGLPSDAFAPARVLRTARPASGPAAARNLGAAHASTPWLCFADADVQPLPGVGAALREGLARAAPEEIFQGTYARSLDLANPISRYKSLYHEFRYTRCDPQELPGLHGYLCVLHRETFRALGGYDTTFRTATVEDDDLGRRALARGCRIRRLAGLEGVHLKAFSLAGLLERAVRVGRGKTELLLRHRAQLHSNSALLQVGLTGGRRAIDLYATLPLAALLLTPLAPLVLGASAAINRRMIAFYLDRSGIGDAVRGQALYHLEILAALVGCASLLLRSDR